MSGWNKSDTSILLSIECKDKDMTKLSVPQIQALHEINAKVAVDLITAKSVTITSLDKRGLIYKGSYIGGVPAWYLTEAGKAAIGLSDNENLPRLDGVEESTEVDADFTPENIARAIEEIESSESDEPAIPFFNRKALRDLRRNQARVNRRMMREQGKRRRKYGADDPKYFRRGYLRMLAETSDTAYDAA